MDSLTMALDTLYITFNYNTDSLKTETYLNGKNVEKEIRSMQVSNHVSQISNVPAVRKKMLKLQRRMAESKGVVMDGRDIGTVVLDDAELKFFLTAEPKIRAMRRYNEIIQGGGEVRLEDVEQNLLFRDEKDSTRENAPLRKAQDAIVIDNSHLTIEEQLDFMHNNALKVIANLNPIQTQA